MINILTGTTMELLTNIFMFLGGIGLFLVGFKTVSGNIENLAGRQLKKLFSKTSKNKILSVGIGAASTALVQSSAATTVMVVGFVNAGIMTLIQAAPVIIGANIGTTITALIMALGGTSFKVYFIALIGVGGFMNLLFSKKEKVKGWGLVIAGLGMMFLGMSMCSEYMTNIINSSESIKAVIAGLTNPFLLLLVGMVLTMLIQSSAAVTILVMSLSTTGLFASGNYLLFLILGTNIGTCLTAIVSSVGASKNAKRASMIHLLFNVLGSTIFFIFLWLYKGFNDDVLARLFADQEMQIAMFHFMFNFTCALIFIPLSNLFVKVSQLIIKDGKAEEEDISLLDERFLHNGEIAMSQVKKEMIRMGSIYMKALRMSFDAFIHKDEKKAEDIREMISKGLGVNQGIVDYIVKIPGEALNHALDYEVQATYQDISDLDRLGEIADNLIKHTKKSVDEELIFSDLVKVELEKMMTKLEESYQSMSKYLLYKNPEYFISVSALEDEIDNMRTTLVEDHLKRLDEGKCHPNSSGVFINLVGNLERAGDHINFVAERYHQSQKEKK